MWERTRYLYDNDPEYKLRQREQVLAVQPLAVKASLSEQAREKRKESFKKIGHQKGPANSQFGTRWITNGDTNKKIKKTDPIPPGFREGRKFNSPDTQ